MAQVGNLYVDDEEFLGRGGELASHRNFFSEVLEEYIKIVDYLCDNIEGETARAIKELANSLRSVPSKIVSQGIYYQYDCEQFISEIDKADSFLY